MHIAYLYLVIIIGSSSYAVSHPTIPRQVRTTLNRESSAFTTRGFLSNAIKKVGGPCCTGNPSPTHGSFASSQHQHNPSPWHGSSPSSSHASSPQHQYMPSPWHGASPSSSRASSHQSTNSVSTPTPLRTPSMHGSSPTPSELTASPQLDPLYEAGKNRLKQQIPGKTAPLFSSLHESPKNIRWMKKLDLHHASQSYFSSAPVSPASLSSSASSGKGKDVMGGSHARTSSGSSSGSRHADLAGPSH